MPNATPTHPPSAFTLSPKARALQRVLLALVILNTLTFFAVALAGRLNVEGKALVFVDFWGRFTVYSLWFILYAAYRRVIAPYPGPRVVVAALVILNIPFFLLMAYFDKISNAPATLVYVDFWGRISVYSLWFIAYEVYRLYLLRDRAVAAV